MADNSGQRNFLEMIVTQSFSVTSEHFGQHWWIFLDLLITQRSQVQILAPLPITRKGVALKNAAPFLCPKSVLGTFWEQNAPKFVFFRPKKSSNFDCFFFPHSSRFGVPRLVACTNRLTTPSHRRNSFERLWSDERSRVRKNIQKIFSPLKTFTRLERPPPFCPIPWR